ncbi:ABC transporter permease [Alicyclobacillus sp. SO9]|nr:ABC transporter permease [Alicyclobacillus sp. SO9]
MSPQETNLVKMRTSNKQRSSLFRIRVKKAWRNKLAVIGFIICVLITLLSILAPFITSYDPYQMNLAQISHPPSSLHIFGTDTLGRDEFARILYGGRVSIYVGVLSALSETVIGVILGALAGYLSGWLDGFLVKFSELTMTFPSLILILILELVLGQGINNLIFVFAITGWTTTFRLVRNEFLSLREETYVSVCRSLGIRKTSIIFKHMLPNALSPVIVSLTTNIGIYILTSAGLSFLGLGVPVGTPSWGNMISAAKSLDVVRNYWWLWIIPGITISLFVLSINFVGDGLRDILDPKQ